MTTLKTKLLIPLLAGLVFTAACHHGEEPTPASDSDHRTLWNFFWQDLRICYPFFELDRVNWDSTNRFVRARLDTINPSHNPSDSLFRYMTLALSPLLDGHASLTGVYAGRDSIWSHPERQTKSSGFSIPLVLQNYLRQPSTGFQTELVQQGYLYRSGTKTDIYYIWIRTFGTAGVGDMIESALRAEGSNIGGLVIDVRSNGGGLIAESEQIASIFYGSAHTWGQEKIKNGPGKDDFTSYQPLVLDKTSSLTYQGKAVLLTNRYSASASERLRLMTRGLSNLTCIGDTTYGATSPIIERMLPNGWKYVSVGSVTEDLNGKTYERIGVPPDVVVQNSQRQLQLGNDEALNKAIQVLTP